MQLRAGVLESSLHMDPRAQHGQFLVRPGGLEAWNATHGDAPAVAGSATAPSGGSIKPAPSFAAMFGAAPKASWLLKGAARAGMKQDSTSS